jgi:heme oxygenase (biliverdin-IX-beta and delta-forming)
MVLMETLKERTDVHHRNIESVKRFSRVFAEDYQLDEYKKLLEKFYGFYKPLEDQFVAHQSEMSPLDFNPRKKVHLIVSDLKTLGYSQGDIDALPLCTQLPNTSTLARMMGCFYVLEGSTMGGQMISKQLAKTFEFAPGEGVVFYACYGKDTMVMWKGFKEYVNEHYSTETDLDDISQAAGETFEALGRWMDLP